MTTLSIQKVGSRAKKLLSLGGDVGKLAVTDGGTVLATARFPGLKLAMEVGGRRLTASRKWNAALEGPTELEVVDDATGEKVIDGKHTSGKRQEQEWAFTLAGGRTISWIYHAEQEKLGFYDAGGAPIMRMGHDPSFDTSAPGGTFRVLLRFWGAAIESADRYIAFVEDGAVGKAVMADELPVLALVGMWLESAAEGGPDVTPGMAG